MEGEAKILMETMSFKQTNWERLQTVQEAQRGESLLWVYKGLRLTPELCSWQAEASNAKALRILPIRSQANPWVAQVHERQSQRSKIPKTELILKSSHTESKTKPMIWWEPGWLRAKTKNQLLQGIQQNSRSTNRTFTKFKINSKLLNKQEPGKCGEIQEKWP